MERDRNDRDQGLLGSITPKHPASAGGAVLGIGLEHLFLRVQGIAEGGEGMGVEAWMVWVLGAELVRMMPSTC